MNFVLLQPIFLHFNLNSSGDTLNQGLILFMSTCTLHILNLLVAYLIFFIHLFQCWKWSKDMINPNTLAQLCKLWCICFAKVCETVCRVSIEALNRLPVWIFTCSSWVWTLRLPHPQNSHDHILGRCMDIFWELNRLF